MDGPIGMMTKGVAMGIGLCSENKKYRKEKKALQTARVAVREVQTSDHPRSLEVDRQLDDATREDRESVFLTMEIERRPGGHGHTPTKSKQKTSQIDIRHLAKRFAEAHPPPESATDTPLPVSYTHLTLPTIYSV